MRRQPQSSLVLGELRGVAASVLNNHRAVICGVEGSADGVRITHLNGTDRVILVSSAFESIALATNTHQVAVTDLIGETFELVAAVATEAQEVGLIVVTILDLLKLGAARSRTIEGHLRRVIVAKLDLAGLGLLGQHLAAARSTDLSLVSTPVLSLAESNTTFSFAKRAVVVTAGLGDAGVTSSTTEQIHVGEITFPNLFHVGEVIVAGLLNVEFIVAALPEDHPRRKDEGKGENTRDLEKLSHGLRSVSFKKTILRAHPGDPAGRPDSSSTQLTGAPFF